MYFSFEKAKTRSVFHRAPRAPNPSRCDCVAPGFLLQAKESSRHTACACRGSAPNTAHTYRITKNSDTKQHRYFFTNLTKAINLSLFSHKACNTVFKLRFHFVSVLILNKHNLTVVFQAALSAEISLHRTLLKPSVLPL